MEHYLWDKFHLTETEFIFMGVHSYSQTWKQSFAHLLADYSNYCMDGEVTSMISSAFADDVTNV